MRKDTIAGKRAFSLFSVYSCNFSLFQFTVCFFACKDTMRRYGGLGNRGTSREIKRLTGKYCAKRKEKMPNSIRQNGRSLISFLYGRLRGSRAQMVFERNKNTRRNGRRQQTISRGTTNAALTHGARDKEKHIPTRMPVCDRGGIGQQLLTIGQQFFLYSFFYRRL